MAKKKSEKIIKMEEVLAQSNEFVVLDIETTGLSPSKGGRIIEIGAKKVIGNKIVDRFSQLIHPEMKISPKITKITGITNEMVSDKPVYREVLLNFYNFIGNSVVVAHNASFDWDRFLLHYFKNVGIIPNNPIVDTLALSKLYYPGLSSYKLENLCNEVGVELTNAHRAESDAEATANLLIKLKTEFAQKIKPETKQFDLFSTAKPTERLIPEKVPTTNDNFVIRRIAYWEKQVSKKVRYERIYVTLDIGTAYFDIPTRTWGIDKCNVSVDLKLISKRTVDELQNKVFKHTQVLQDINNSVIKIEDMLIA